MTGLYSRIKKKISGILYNLEVQYNYKLLEDSMIKVAGEMQIKDFLDDFRNKAEIIFKYDAPVKKMRRRKALEDAIKMLNPSCDQRIAIAEFLKKKMN